MTLRLSIIRLSIFAVLLSSACNADKANTKLLDGDLYYSWFRIGSFYNQPDSIIEKVKKSYDTINRKFLSPSDLKSLTMYETLKKENLLYRPFIDMKLDNDSIVKVYLTKDDYSKINIFNRQELLDTKKKIRIKTEVRDLGLGMALCTRLLSVNKVDGQTFQVSKKLKIDDYR
jgi:hypothetical protein